MVTGAIYDLQAPCGSTQVQVGAYDSLSRTQFRNLQVQKLP